MEKPMITNDKKNNNKATVHTVPRNAIPTKSRKHDSAPEWKAVPVPHIAPRCDSCTSTHVVIKQKTKKLDCHFVAT